MLPEPGFSLLLHRLPITKKLQLTEERQLPDSESGFSDRDHGSIVEIILANFQDSNEQIGKLLTPQAFDPSRITDGPVAPDIAKSVWKSASNVTTILPF